jgi:hypothetical protein
MKSFAYSGVSTATASLFADSSWQETLAFSAYALLSVQGKINMTDSVLKEDY